MSEKEKAVRLWSPRGNMDDKSTHLSLSSGHTLIVTSDKAGTIVPLRFRKEAIARGCIPVGMEEEADDSQAFDRDTVIREQIKMMLESDDSSMFTTDGKPVLDKLSGLCGFALARSEVNRVWEAMMKDEDDTAEVVSVNGKG